MTREKTRGRSVLAMVLTMALVLTLVPVAALAEDVFAGTLLADSAEEQNADAGSPLDEGVVSSVNVDTDADEALDGGGKGDTADDSTVVTGDATQPPLDQTDDATRGESAEGLDEGLTAAGEDSDGEDADDSGEDEVPDEGAPLPSGAVDVAEDTYYIESNVSDEKVLDAAGKQPSAGSNVASWSYNGGANQQWTLRKDEESGWYHLFLASSDETLALSLKPTSSNASNVGLAKASDMGDDALWAFVKNGTWFNLYNRASGQWLEVAGGSTENKANIQVGIQTADTKKQQRFFLLDASPSVSAIDSVTEAAYKVSPSANSKVAAEVRGAKTDSGTNVWLYTSNNKEHQKIYLEKTSSGLYVAWIVGTGRVIAQESAAIIPGTNVVQRAYASGDAKQLWAVRNNGDDTYSLINKASGLALGAAGSSSGSNLTVTRNDRYKTTRFTFTRRALLSAGIVEIHPRTSSSVSLDVQKAASSGSARLLLWTDSDALNQRFELVSAGSTDQWRIRTASSGGWITDTGSAIQQEGSYSTAASAQNTWRVTFKGGGYTLVNKSTGKAMSMNNGKTDKGTSIVRSAPNGKDAQHFTFTKTGLITTGCRFIQSKLGTYLDVADDSSSAGANIQMWSKKNVVGEYFTVEKSGSHYRIKNTYSGKYLTAAGTSNSSNVSQQNSSNAESQLWDAVIADGGYVGFIGVASGKALDVKRNSTSNGANVQIYTANRGNGQAWKLIKTEYQPYTGYVLRAVNNANASSSVTGYLLVVDKSECKVIVMEGGNGSWRPTRTMLCSVGAPSTPTVEGSFTVQDRGVSFGEGYTCWYWTQFYNDYLFHSVLYNEGSKTSIQDGRLGMHISHGCVRMDIDDAYWIYANIPRGTRVLVYT